MYLSLCDLFSLNLIVYARYNIERLSHDSLFLRCFFTLRSYRLLISNFIHTISQIHNSQFSSSKFQHLSSFRIQVSFLYAIFFSSFSVSCVPCFIGFCFYFTFGAVCLSVFFVFVIRAIRLMCCALLCCVLWVREPR